MKIGLHDADKTNFPNLALMKISAWHKAQGHEVGWYNALFGADKVYSSKVFTFSSHDEYLPDSTTLGGVGYDLTEKLPEEIEHISPDYSLYNSHYSQGFTTRGCTSNSAICKECVVPWNEGNIKPHAKITEFLAHDKCVLMDNNILAHQHGIEQLEYCAEKGIKIDINQGVDAALIDDGIAKLFSKIKWLEPVRLACDRADRIDVVREAITRLRWRDVRPERYSCYILIRDDIQDAMARLRFLKGMAVDPFAQPYLDRKNTPPTQEQKDLARWVNHKATFKSVWWENYKQ